MSRLTAVLIVFALALVALGVYDITRGNPAAEEPAAAGADVPAAGADAPPAAAGVDLTTAQLPLGAVVTSGGATLYRFDKDTPKPPTSNCNGACASTWPPLLSQGATPTASGVDQALVGTLTRADGAEQVTLNGWPLYTYAADGPGETKGEGVGGTWHAIAPSGKPAVGSGAAPGGSGAGGAGGAGQTPAPEPQPAPGGGY